MEHSSFNIMTRGNDGAEFDLMPRAEFCGVQHRLFCEDNGWDASSDPAADSEKAEAMKSVIAAHLSPVPTCSAGA